MKKNINDTNNNNSSILHKKKNINSILHKKKNIIINNDNDDNDDDINININDNILHNSIAKYKQSTFQLADILYQLKLKHGRKNLLLLSGLDLCKLNWFCAIGSFVNKNYNLLPEHYAEIVGLKDSNKIIEYLNIAVKDRLTPCQLRKLIRTNSKSKMMGTTPSSTKPINLFGKYLLNIQSEINKMDISQQKRAKEMLAKEML